MIFQLAMWEPRDLALEKIRCRLKTGVLKVLVILVMSVSKLHITRLI